MNILRQFMQFEITVQLFGAFVDRFRDIQYIGQQNDGSFNILANSVEQLFARWQCVHRNKSTFSHYPWMELSERVIISHFTNTGRLFVCFDFAQFE